MSRQCSTALTISYLCAEEQAMSRGGDYLRATT